jgi:hypothetical protein
MERATCSFLGTGLSHLARHADLSRTPDPDINVSSRLRSLTRDQTMGSREVFAFHLPTLRKFPIRELAFCQHELPDSSSQLGGARPSRGSSAAVVLFAVSRLACKLYLA